MLNDKQRAFVQEYLIDRNATQAAIRAGYSEKTAGQIGNENLKKPEIAEAINAGEEKHAERCAVTVEGLTTELDDALLCAKQGNNATAMVSAVMAKAKLHGLLVDKKEDVTKRITPKERDARISELLDRYGEVGITGASGGAESGGGTPKPH